MHKHLAALPDGLGQQSEDFLPYVRRLELALDNMSQGLLMFDSAARVVVVNERYIQMYGLSPEIVTPGCSLRELIQHRKDTGSFVGDVDHYCASILSAVSRGRTASIFADTADGRTINVVYRPIADGGWVVTLEDISERRQAEAQIAHMAHHDALTGLPNRVFFRARLDDELKRRRRRERVAVLYLDLDNFKSVNETLGHPVGDDLLKAVANRLRGCVREIDTVARLGGDEFAIAQTGARRPLDVAELAARVREAVAAPYELADHQIIVDASIGIAISPSDGTNPDQLIKKADLALYCAKTGGRGIYRFFEPEMDIRMTARRNLELDLRKALARGEFELHYQPLVNLERSEISGCEALVRWRHPRRGLVSPAEFIPIAEETGLITGLGEWVIRTACAEAATWPDDLKVAVNVSPVQFKNQNIAQIVISALAATGLPAQRLEIEITEAVLMQHTEATLTTLNQLRELGVRIAMDDFGTGYSSLSYLRSFPFDKIKIDQSFIRDLSDQTESAAIVRAVTGLAASLHMTTTAEGIETEQQCEIAKAAGCTEMQGYLFSRPVSADRIAELMRSPVVAAPALQPESEPSLNRAETQDSARSASLEREGRLGNH
ncbi:EAL domain-containing protein [Bradyrhizobium sp. ISRA443]|uniref:putative bifunctional diguanylate cyclase/phosphodiesterase n=1 Tax=unclassified Bradyrhizobium TaxID=2631580 RepID=UPI00247A885F|nr:MULTISPECIES: EAL domain-containing protein [unclassified Bradyrhizobium]WGR93985.1 EAL domain-containing protein [Bradyrhizobium sp. ISRA435]WGR98612.1 EAL domain-containing protein [Bradyrhizobium sp. ISRA436]WGS05501.1 EAL domain-containing protein [Bradyrhizobium sp. ISRA437]WGS12388.1 EAL domain-containing protein [Bradyrhizobium sp. ISRA443]